MRQKWEPEKFRSNLPFINALRECLGLAPIHSGFGAETVRAGRAVPRPPSTPGARRGPAAGKRLTRAAGEGFGESGGHWADGEGGAKRRTRRYRLRRPAPAGAPSQPQTTIKERSTIGPKAKPL